MKLAEARDIGHDCGLATDVECVRNISLHAGTFFDYTEMAKELAELYSEFDEEVKSQQLIRESKDNLRREMDG